MASVDNSSAIVPIYTKKIVNPIASFETVFDLIAHPLNSQLLLNAMKSKTVADKLWSTRVSS